VVAGYRGGWVDTFFMRVVDVMFAFPGCCSRWPSLQSWGQE
jgi:ABC-type dipeptide/oligopeptide/nickel transport system permease subunit